MTTDNSTSNRPAENPLLSLLINIVLPVLILNKGTPLLGAQAALAVALSLPLIYGAQDFIRRRHRNYVSLLGLFNIALTGGLALFQLTGLWFCLKEALLPFSLGVLVFFSAFGTSPAARLLFYNPHVMNTREIEVALDQRGLQENFRQLLKKATLWLSLSFFLSSAGNFLLALKIFVGIDGSLPAPEQASILNQQIAQMTWMAMLVIAGPLMVFSGLLITWFLRRLSALTELTTDQILKTQ